MSHSWNFFQKPPNCTQSNVKEIWKSGMLAWFIETITTNIEYIQHIYIYQIQSKTNLIVKKKKKRPTIYFFIRNWDKSKTVY